MTTLSPALPLRYRLAMRSIGWFTFGGLLAHYWRPAPRLLPYALTSALLMAAGCWDFWFFGAKVEWIVVGLSAYELMMGLLDAAPDDAVEVVPASHPSNPSMARVES
jgi:hypothetical protein